MRKLTLLSCAALAAMAINSQAQAQTQGGFSGPGPTMAVITVEEAKSMNDDAYVVMQGTIERQVGDENYLFKDKTGTIVVEIDDDDWNGQSVGPNDVVEIKGEIDKGWTTIEIDVDEINKVSK